MSINRKVYMICIVYDSTKYPKHSDYSRYLEAKLAKQDIVCYTHDMASITSKTPRHLHYEDIVSTNADLYIILDGTGFKFRTEKYG